MAKGMVKRCPACDNEFESHSNRGIFCGIACRTWNQNHPGQKAPRKACQTCGAPVPNRRYKYCGADCRPCTRPAGRVATLPKRLRVRSVTCGYCGKQFDTAKRLQKYCTYQCGVAADNGRLSPYELGNRSCEWCQAPVPADKRTGARFCGVTHQVMHNQHIRRARLFKLPVQDVGLSHVIDRDGWQCHLCGEYCSPETVSLDHLIPIACPDSPGHVLENLGVAHRACNSRKRDRVSAHDRERYARNCALEVI